MKRFPTNLRLMLVALCAVCLGVSAWAGLKSFVSTFADYPESASNAPAQVAAPAPVKVKAAAPAIDYTASGNYRLFWDGASGPATSPDNFGEINNDSPWGFYRYTVADGTYSRFTKYDHNGSNGGSEAERGKEWYTENVYCFVSSTGHYHSTVDASPAIVFKAPADGIYFATITVWRDKADKTNTLRLRSRLLEPTTMQCDKENYLFAKAYGTKDLDGVDGKQPQTLDFYIRLNAGQCFTFETESYTTNSNADGRTHIAELAVASCSSSGQPFTLEEAQAYPHFYDVLAVKPAVDFDANGNYHLFKADAPNGIATASADFAQNNDHPWGFCRHERDAGSFTPFLTFDTNNSNAKAENGNAWYTDADYCFITEKGNTHSTNSSSPAILFTAPADGIYYASMTVWRDKEKQSNALVMRNHYLGNQLVTLFEKEYGTVAIDGEYGKTPQTLDFFIKVKQGATFTFEIGDSQSAGRTHISDLGVATCHADGSPFTLDEAKAYGRFYDAVGEEVAAEVIDVLTQTVTGVTGTSYTNFSGKTVRSDAVYAGQCAGGNSSIQLRTNNNNSGVITTTSGGTAKKIVVEWNENTANGRTLQVYGSSTAYSAATDLYSANTQGTLLGEIVCGTSTELTIEGDYAYIGFKSKNQAMYLTSVSITWATASSQPTEPQSQVKTYNIDIEREAGLGSNAQTEYFDFTEAKTFLGVETISANRFDIIQPTGVVEFNYAQYNGWFDTTGAPTTLADLGNNPGICLNFPDALNGGSFTISDQNMTDAAVGQTYDLTWEIQDNSKAVHFRFHITYTAPKPTYTTCKAANEAATANEVASRLTLTDALVTYVVPNSQAYIEDATGGFLIFGSHKFNVGEKFTGTIEGKLVTYHGTPELKDPQYSNLSVTSENNSVTPTEVDAAALATSPLTYVSRYMIVKPATFASTQTVSTKKNVDFTVGNTALVIRNNFTVTFSVDQTKEYSVAGLVTIYDAAKQLYPTKAEDVAEIVPDPDGTDLAAENAAAVAAVTEGQYYRIYTEDATGKKFYMKQTGFLTSDVKQAAKLPIKFIPRTGDDRIDVGENRYEVTAFKFDAHFTNPNCVGNSATGAIEPKGHIIISHQNRDKEESQVFFLGSQSGKYAIRCTAAYSVKGSDSNRWNAQAYWTTTDANNDGLPEAEYGLTADYRWQLEATTDNVDGDNPANENAAAVAAVTNGHLYRIFTQTEAGNKFYMKSDGYLTASEDEAALLPMKQINRTGVNIGNSQIDVTAFKTDARFTNPKCTSKYEGIDPQGHIIVSDQNRDDYESQVFFLGEQSGKYAIRATSVYNIESNKLKWNAHSYWSTTDTNADGLPEAEYCLNADYIWQIEEQYPACDIPQDMPEADTKYTIKNLDADLYMSFDTENNRVVFSTDPVELSFESDNNGGWYITDGTSYVGLDGEYYMSTTADKKAPVTLSAYNTPNGIAYVLNEAKGVIGCDDLIAGKKCYSNKKTNNHGFWILTPIVPEPEPEGDVIYVDKQHGTYYNGANEPLTDSGWGASWKSTQTDPQLSLTASSGINVQNGMHFGPAGVTYTLSVPNGYVITAYSLTATNFPDGSSVLTPEGGQGQAFTANKPNKVTDLSAQTTTFTITEGRAQVTEFKVYVKEVEVVEPVVFAKIISDNNLIAGEKYLVVYEEGNVALGAISTTSTKYGLPVDVTITDGQISITDEAVDVLTLSGDADGWSFASSLAEGYLNWTSGNSLNVAAESANTKWTITFDEDGNALIVNSTDETRNISYNTGSPRFATYGNLNQKRIQLYKAGEILAPPADVAAPTITPATGIYTSAQRVTMRAEEGATIFYTVNDGDEKEYDKPFSVSETSVIVAYAKVGNVTSPTTTVTITIQNTGDAPMMVFNDEGTQTFTLASDEDITAEDKSGNVIDVTGEDIEDGIVVAYQNVQIENAEAYVAGFRASATITDSKGNTYTVKTRADENNVMYVAKGLFGPNETYEVTIQPIVYYNYDQFCDAIYELWETGKATHQIPDPDDPVRYDELNNPIPGTGESTILDPAWTLAAAAAEWSQQLKDNGTIPYTGDVVLFQDCDPMPYYVDNTPHVFIIKTDNSVNANVKALLSQEFKAFDAEGNDFTAEFLTINGGIATVISGVNGLNGDARIYNMSGQRVAKTTKGLYIINGKKVAIK